MSKKWSGLPKVRVHIEAYKEDWLWLTSRYTGRSNLSAAGACREIIHNRVRALRQREIDLTEQALEYTETTSGAHE